MLIENNVPMLAPATFSRVEEGGVSIRDYLDLLLENKKIIGSILAVVLTLTVLYGLARDARARRPGPEGGPDTGGPE